MLQIVLMRFVQSHRLRFRNIHHVFRMQTELQLREKRTLIDILHVNVCGPWLIVVFDAQADALI